MAATIVPDRPSTITSAPNTQTTGATIQTSTQSSTQTSKALRLLRRRERLDRAHRITARVVLGAIGLQVLFAGIGVFGVYSFLPHAIFGSLLILSSFSLPILAQVGHLDRWVIRRSWLLAGLMVLQGLLIDAGHLVRAISALHPVNAMLLVLVTFTLATRARN